MEKTIFEISKMDCPSEERLIRMKLSELEFIHHLDFELNKRTITVFHTGDSKAIEKSISELKLGEKLLSSEKTDQLDFKENKDQKKLLWAVLIINFVFFIVEMSTGLIAGSMGLVADSLDMLADSLVYGISLYAVGGSLNRKKRVASVAGYFQLTLAFIGFTEVVRRFISSEMMPDFTTMIIVSILALIANIICLYLLRQSKSKEEAHMQASMIFTSNDVIINLGVILAGIMVFAFQSKLPDLIIGSIVFILVIRGAIRILKLGK
ncbi:MAG: cation transporter [Brumimicrobium sp.]|nr:cation transporter [Brumimicrobium sp.]